MTPAPASQLKHSSSWDVGVRGIRISGDAFFSGIGRLAAEAERGFSLVGRLDQGTQLHRYYEPLRRGAVLVLLARPA
jgi:hypothetical protein